MFTFVLEGRVSRKLAGKGPNAILILGGPGETPFPHVRVLVRDRTLWQSVNDNIQAEDIVRVEGQIERVRTARVGVDCFVFDFIGERVERVGRYSPQGVRP